MTRRLCYCSIAVIHIGANVDVTERDETEKARELLVEELNHRVKNTLSVVQAIAHQTFGKNADPSKARRAFEGRLIALGRPTTYSRMLTGRTRHCRNLLRSH
jgi:two-component sensor histidine kinase